jgi:hypothetical protein
MCDTASLELSKELYKLSGWEYLSHQWMSPFDDEHPVYDLGYLVRKLSPITLNRGMNGWDIYVHEGQLHQAMADTPEDAACLLAIHLFKQGILQKE